MGSRQGTPLPDLSALRIDDHARGSGGGSRWFRWFAAAVGVLLICAGALFAIRGRVPEVEVVAAQATGGTRSVLLNASGYVTPRRRATVAAKVTGRVTQMLAEEGMRVQEGQLLATLDDSDVKARLNSAIADRDATRATLADLRVNLTDSDRELKRTEELRRGGVSSQQALDAATTRSESLRARITQTERQVQAAEARISMAQQDVDNCTIRAPFAGIIVSKDAQRGEMVSPVSAGGGFTRTGIATIVDMNSLEVEVDVNESYIARVKPGMPVTSVLDAYPEWQIPSKVRTVIPTADRQKATVKVRITFEKLDPRILPDMGVKVNFLGDQEPQRQEAIVTVPKNAVRQDQGASIVWAYHDEKVERRAVRLGGVRGNDQEVLAGVKAGDQVVTSGFEDLKDGQKAQIKK